MTRILAIEPDAERAAILQRLMTESLDAKIMLASSANDATTTLASERPDVILASSLLPPKDEEHLIAHLRQMPELRHLPVLVIPPVGEQPEPQVKGGLWSRFRRRRASISPAYDFQAVTARIEEAVEQSRLQAASAANVETVPEVIDAPPEIVSAADVQYVEPIKRNRAQRWTAAQLPWLSSIKLAWGRDLRLLNISRSGVLVESGVRFTPGTTTMLQIAGTDQHVAVSATIVRSRVAAVDSLGVTYQSAATFERTFDLLQPDEEPADNAAHLDELVAAVRERAAHGAHPAELRGEFEAGVRKIVRAREIRLRDVPVVENDGCESVYFTIPSPDRSAVLQITFEPNWVPSADEFSSLSAAAQAAAQILPLTGTARHVSLLYTELVNA